MANGHIVKMTFNFKIIARQLTEDRFRLINWSFPKRRTADETNLKTKKTIAFFTGLAGQTMCVCTLVNGIVTDEAIMVYKVALAPDLTVKK